MHRSTKIGLIALAILLCVVIVVLLINLQYINPSQDADCLREDKNSTCYSTNPSPYRYYGTKTTYREAVGNYTDDSDLPLENCTAKVFYLLSRHATRYPDRKEIKELNKFLPRFKNKIVEAARLGQGHFCEEDLKKLKRWRTTLVPENDNNLSRTGKAEAEHLAKRLKERFPVILGQSYSPENFVFEYTSRERTKTTAEAFAEGLFNTTEYYKIDFRNKTNDEVLTFHRYCKPLQKSCVDPDYDISEIKKVEDGELMKGVVNRVSEKVGFPVTRDDIEIMYRGCVFGHALETGDIWCSLFTTADLKVLEFEDDIDDYYKDAYGNKVNYEQACPVAKYIVDLFESSVNTDRTRSVLHFTHAGAIKKVYPMFGLFRDPLPLTADAFCSQTKRSWRSSFIAPFNSNMVLVLYKCPDEHKVLALQNERPVEIMGCPDVLCSYDQFQKVYNIVASDCNLDKICCSCCKIR